jgi:fatty-acyl-CoA synthase
MSEFKAEWDTLEPELAIIQAMIDARKNSGITQKQLSEKTGIAQSDISKIENGNANPSLRTLKRLAAAMDMKLKLEFLPINIKNIIKNRGKNKMLFDTNDLIEITFGNLLNLLEEKYPDNLCVKYCDRDYERTFAEFNREVEKAAKGFLSLGIGKGDHIAIWATNVPEWLLTFFAAAKIGAVLVTVNTSYKIFEAEYLLRQSDSKAVVLIDGFKDSDYIDIRNKLVPTLATHDKTQEIKSPTLPYLKRVIYAGKKEETPGGMIRFNELFGMGETFDQNIFDEIVKTLDVHDVVNMQYTSGTTGFPKGVMLTHFNIVNNGKNIGDCMKLTPDDKYCICVPFFHCFGMVLSITASVTHASAMVPVDFYSPVPVMEAVQNENCTALNGVPTRFINILEHPTFSNYKFEKLRTGIMAGSPCPVKVMQDVVDNMNMNEITIVFGQTESSPGCTQTTTDDSLELRVSTVGRTLPFVEAKVINPETGETLGPNTPGEFCARGYNIMRGYYKMEEATKQAIDKDGWLHTGDIATVDENGYYKITGRLKDMIIRGGENIYPKEIEEFIYTIPQVKDVQVIGVPSKQYGEEIMAYVILKEGETMTEDELKQLVRGSLARHKVPKYVKFTASFPMTASGKIQKYKMREEAVEELGLGEEDKIVTA